MPKPQRKKNTLANMQADWQQEANRLLIQKLGLGTVDSLDLVQAYDSNQSFKKLIVISADPILVEFTRALVDYRNDLKNNVEEPTITLSPQAFNYGKNALMESLNIKPTQNLSVTEPDNSAPSAANDATAKSNNKPEIDWEKVSRQNKVTLIKFQRKQEKQYLTNTNQKQNNQAIIGMNWAA